MPRNASGVYTLPAGNPVVTNTPVATAWGNGTMADLAAEIQNSLDRSGRGRMLVPFLVLDGSAPAPTLSFVNEAGTGFYRAGAGQLGLSILGSLVALFTSAGITFTGAATLVGDVAITGDLSVSDDLTVVDDVSVGGDLTVTTAATLPAATTIGGVSAAEVAYLTNVTSDIQAQINAKVTASVGQTWGGVQDFVSATSILVPTQAPSDNSTKAASTAFVNAVAFAAALPAQSAATAGMYPRSDGVSAAWASIGLARDPRISNTLLVNLDGGKLIDATTGTFAQTVDVTANLATAWSIDYTNSGTGVITFTPTGGELIDGLASIPIYPQEVRRIYRSGSGFKSFIVNGFVLEPTGSISFIEPPGYRAYEVFIIAPGGGGGSGRRGAASSVRGGGGGGGAGASAWATVKAATPGATIAVTVGAAGVGGAAVTVNDTSGSVGTTGGTSSFGTLLNAAGGVGGGAGVAGAAAGGAAGVTAGQIVIASTEGGAGGGAGVPAVAGVVSAPWGATGAGGGGAISAANVVQAAAAGGASGTSAAATQLAGGLAGATGAPGGNGNSSVAERPGTGGGGGGAHLTNPGSVGGIGVRGGGGGGGSGSTNGADSGAGGATTGYYYIRGIF